MVGSNLMDEIDCGNFFDNMDDLLEFPNGDLDSDFISAVNRDSDTFNGILSDNSSEIFGCDSVFGGNSSADLSAELSVPYEDIVQLEWLSTFVEDSFSGGGMTMENLNNVSSSSSLTTDPFTSHNQFKTSSPVSVLDSTTTTSSISCSHSDNNNISGTIVGNTIPVISHEKRARSKRPRPTTFNPRSAIHVIPTPSSSCLSDYSQPAPAFVPCSSSESVTTTESNSIKEESKILVESSTNQLLKTKKKKIKIIPPSSEEKRSLHEDDQDLNSSATPVRKCMHCEITKTPQWRAGPMGPKTLCNACGVRYKSGRLFPEYRPAASPTFVPALHSNSHKKVIEMRTKVVPGTECTSTSGMCSSRVPAPGVVNHDRQGGLIGRRDLMPEAYV